MVGNGMAVLSARRQQNRRNNYQSNSTRDLTTEEINTAKRMFVSIISVGLLSIIVNLIDKTNLDVFGRLMICIYIINCIYLLMTCFQCLICCVCWISE